MSEKYSPTPEELARSQNRFARDLIEHGASVVQDPGADKLRVELTGDEMEEAMAVNDMVSSNREREGEFTANDFLEWMRTNPYQALSFITEQYGSLEEFQRRATLRAKYRIDQLQQDKDHPVQAQDEKAA